MATLDIFDNDAFSLASLATAVDKVPYKPSLLGDMDLFADMPVRTTTIFIEVRAGVLNLVQTSPRGAPAPQRTTEKRKAYAFKAHRIAKSDRIMADELQNVRAFGSETELMQMQAEVMRRLSGPVGLQPEIEYTWENMRLGAIQGIVLDADNSVLDNFYTGLNVAQPAEIAFDLAGANAPPGPGASGVLRGFIQAQVVRPMMRAAQGAFLPSTQIIGLCGDAFFDQFTNHGEVRQTFINQQEASDLRKGNAFLQFDFGGVTWINYRGSDDGATMGVATDKVKFFPKGAPGVFQVAWAPAETFDFVNTPGKPLYPMIVVDEQRKMFADIELYSYPLFFCSRPGVLYSGRRGA